MLRELLGYRGWKVWASYNMHVCLLTLFYVLLAEDLSVLLPSLVLISSLGFYFMYGFLINDFFDMPFDIAAGKRRAVHKLPRVVFVAIILLVVFISALHLLYLRTPHFIVVYSFAYVLATLYSAPPTRLKTRGAVGIVTNGLIEKALPVFAIFCYFQHFTPDAYVFVAAAFLAELVEIMTHQILDYEADVKTGVRTFVTDVGLDTAFKIYRGVVCPATAAAMLLVCVLICSLMRYAVFVVVGVLAAYPALVLLIRTGRIQRGKKAIPLYMSWLYVLFYSALPVFLALVLVFRSFSNTPLLLVALASQYYIVKYNLNSLKKRELIHFEIFADT